MNETLADSLPPLLPLLVGLPLLLGAAGAALRKNKLARHIISLGTLLGLFAFSILLVAVTSDGTVLATKWVSGTTASPSRSWWTR